MSSVRPASFVHGLIEGRIDFAGWFGQNSRAQKSARLLRSISHHSHLKNGTIPTAMRYDILPFLARFVLHNLQAGEAGISKTIELLDAYALTKEDCDSIFELTLTDALGTEALRKIPASVKASFTRQYGLLTPSHWPVHVDTIRGHTCCRMPRMAQCRAAPPSAFLP